MVAFSRAWYNAHIPWPLTHQIHGIALYNDTVTYIFVVVEVEAGLALHVIVYFKQNLQLYAPCEASKRKTEPSGVYRAFGIDIC